MVQSMIVFIRHFILSSFKIYQVYYQVSLFACKSKLFLKVISFLIVIAYLSGISENFQKSLCKKSILSPIYVLGDGFTGKHK